jgi:hypothetical protein
MFFRKMLTKNLFSWFSCTSLSKGFIQSHRGVEKKYCKDGMEGHLQHHNAALDRPATHFN